jgi:hypothetical protein
MKNKMKIENILTGFSLYPVYPGTVPGTVALLDNTRTDLYSTWVVSRARLKSPVSVSVSRNKFFVLLIFYIFYPYSGRTVFEQFSLNFTSH